MSNKNPMIDLEDCDDVHLEGNKTASEQLLKARKSTAIRAINNEAGVPQTAALPHKDVQGPDKRPAHKEYLSQIIVAVIAGLLVLAIASYFGLNA